jgi:gas vesicle protein
MGSLKVYAGTLLGLVAGVALGMLTAPAKGSETRQRIVETADSLKRRLIRFRELGEEELDELREIFENDVQGLTDDIREKVLRLIHESEAKYKNIEEDVWGY